MTSEYQYDDTTPTRTPSDFGPLPEGDYDFVVIHNDFADSTSPYKNKQGRWVLNLKLQVGPQKQHVFYAPWTGLDKNGEKHDNIAEFLRGVGKAPLAGQPVDWNGLIGARGRLHLKVETETYQQSKLFGKEVNKVGYIITPRDTKGATTAPARQSPAATKKPHPFDPDLDAAPDDIPF
jgi:hypothetical protein